MTLSKIDILAIGVHPDDVELGASGTLLKHKEAGYTFGICDLTQGELGTRGSGPLRLIEAERSAEILGSVFRVNLGMRDGFFEHNESNLKKIISIIRACQPKIVLCNAPHDRHPDHGRASKLVSDACFYSGLIKIETIENGVLQLAHRPDAVYHYIQDRSIKADLVVDISNYIDKKIEAIMAFSSQFYDPNSDEPETPISSKNFIEFVKAKNKTYARDIQVEFAEGYVVERVIGIDNLFNLR